MIAKITIDNYNAKAKIESNNHLGTTNLIITDIVNSYTKTINVTNNFAGPIVDFYADQTTVGAGGFISFTDNTLNSPTSWNWQFGDGGSSFQQNPTHTYNSIGNYTVTLTATNGDGSGSLTKTDYVTVNSAPFANFAAEETTVGIDGVITFIDFSLNTPTSWLWDFGDGTTGTVQNPEHPYSSIGDYTVSLTVENDDGSDVLVKGDYISVLPPPAVNFSADITTVGLSGEINFIDNTLNNPTSWFWEFGDGYTSTGQHPSHEYLAMGTYTISLTATNIYGSHNLIKTDYITINSAPFADFSASETIIELGNAISFTDNSLNNPPQWSWDFGDGNTSTVQHPSYTYTSTGTYNISLTVSNTDGSDIKTIEDYIHIYQIPIIEWQKSFGGSDIDNARSIHETTGGGFVVAGYSYSNTGQVSNNHGGADYWIVLVGQNGSLGTRKCMGGSAADWAHSTQETTDGGFIVAGSSGSNDGDVTGNHGDSDFWVVKWNQNGNIDWQKCLGGSVSDHASSIQETADGGFIVAGYSNSNNGDVTGNHGESDYWIVKLDQNGNIEWQKSLGGSHDDEAKSVQQTTDGGFIVAGYSESNDGDVTGNHGVRDYWVVKLDQNGVLIWQKSLGGLGSDEAYSVQETTDGGFIIAGESNYNGGDVTGNHGDTDYWVVKLDQNGNIEWQKSLGGSHADEAKSVQQTTDGGFIVAGISESNDGDVTGNHGNYDYWITKLDQNGNLVWQKSLGGSDTDRAYSIQETTDGGYIVAGSSQSNNGDVTGNHGQYDYWIVKLSFE